MAQTEAAWLQPRWGWYSAIIAYRSPAIKSSYISILPLMFEFSTELYVTQHVATGMYVFIHLFSTLRGSKCQDRFISLSVWKSPRQRFPAVHKDSGIIIHNYHGILPKIHRMPSAVEPDKHTNYSTWQWAKCWLIIYPIWFIHGFVSHIYVMVTWSGFSLSIWSIYQHDFGIVFLNAGQSYVPAKQFWILKKENKIKVRLILWDVEVYTSRYANKKSKTMKRVYSIMSNLQTNCHWKLNEKWAILEEVSGSCWCDVE